MASKENQKALKDIIECHGCNGNYCECGNFQGCENCLAPYTLRKAIDRLELLEKENNYFKNACVEFDKSITKYAEKTRKYEKALDKAIIIIDNIYGSCPKDAFDFNKIDCEKLCGERTDNTCLCWKEYLLSEVENEKV